jgi:Uma2 family endonuclease
MQPVDAPHRPKSSLELPHSDGEPMESARHWQQMTILIQSLDHAWRSRDDFYVAGNMFLYFSETQTRRNDFRGPDVFVVLNTTRRERRSWVVWEENGQTPDVIIELLSESTEAIDRGEKMRIYGRSLKVGEYFLYDPFSGVLEGYELDSKRGTYTRKPLDAKGRVRCEQLGLSLGRARATLFNVDIEWLRWLDSEGRPLLLPVEELDQAVNRGDAEARRADAEARRADAEARRAEELARELERLRAESKAEKT